MILKITSKRQVTFPAAVLEALGVAPGDQLELEERSGSYIVRPSRMNLERLAMLKDNIPP